MSLSSINAPVLVYHASARSIVFRDHVRRAMHANESNINNGSIELESDDESIHSIEVTPLPRLEFGKYDEFDPLISSENNDMTDDESIALESIITSKAVVKTIKYDCWESFLSRLVEDNKAFRSSTSLLPEGGKRMRCYGQSLDEYPTGVVFRLPNIYKTLKEESEAASEAGLWCFPAGYAARTEYNVDSRGNLINGRNEALVSFERIRELNNSYLNDSRIFIAGKLIDSDLLETLPYVSGYCKKNISCQCM